MYNHNMFALGNPNKKLYKEIEDLIKITDKFKKENPVFFNDYKRYLDEIYQYKKNKKENQQSSAREQFCGIYNE